jgi:hypothetical protein
MNIRIAFSLLLIALSFAACGRGAGGWPQGVRDKVIGGCVKEAKAGGAPIEDAKLTNYCTCYQQNVEKTFPNPNDLVKVTPQDGAKEAQKCIELMFK